MLWKQPSSNPSKVLPYPITLQRSSPFTIRHRMMGTPSSLTTLCDEASWGIPCPENLLSSDVPEDREKEKQWEEAELLSTRSPGYIQPGQAGPGWIAQAACLEYDFTALFHLANHYSASWLSLITLEWVRQRDEELWTAHTQTITATQYHLALWWHVFEDLGHSLFILHLPCGWKGLRTWTVFGCFPGSCIGNGAAWT